MPLRLGETSARSTIDEYLSQQVSKYFVISVCLSQSIFFRCFSTSLVVTFRGSCCLKQTWYDLSWYLDVGKSNDIKERGVDAAQLLSLAARLQHWRWRGRPPSRHRAATDQVNFTAAEFLLHKCNEKLIKPRLSYLAISPPPPGRGLKCFRERVCLCLSSRISETVRPNVTAFSPHINCGRSSVLLWRRRNTLCTSGFVNDVMFAHNRPGRGVASRVYSQSDSPGGRTAGEVWYLQYWLVLVCNCGL